MYCTTQATRKGVCGHATPIAALAAAVAALVLAIAALATPASAWADDSGVADCPYDFDSNGDGSMDSWFFSADRDDSENQVYAYLVDDGETLVVAGRGATVENIDSVQPDADKKVSVNKSEMMGSLKTIRVEEGVTLLGGNLVRNTKAISVELPASLEKMQIAVLAAGDGSLSTLGNNYYDSGSMVPSGIARIIVADGNAAYKVVDGVLFSADGKILYRYTNEAAAEYVVPDGVETIAAKAFARSEHLTKITMNEGLLTIAQDAFDKDSEIAEVTIPSTVRNLGNAAFTACKNLAQATYLMTDYDIWKNQFNSDNVALKKVSFAEGLKSIPDEAFASNKTLELVELPSTIEVIGWRAFTNCEKLQSVAREGVELSQLKEFHYAENQASSGAFSGCTSLTNFPISKDAPLKEIGANAFYGSGLTSFTAPDALEVIGSSAFSNCANLSRFDFNEGLKCIKLRAFDQCISLQSLHIAGAIESIENYAFNNDARIDTISITANGDLDLNEYPFQGVAASNISIGSLSGDVVVDGVGSGGKATSLKLFGNNVDFGSHLLSMSPTGDSPWHSFDLTGVKTMSSSIESANKCWIWYLGAKSGASWLNKGIVYLGDSDAQASFEATLSGGSDNRPHVDAVTNGGAFSDSTDFEGGVLATPKKDGYIFSGWYENADFSGDVVSAPAAGKTYYAKWTKKADSDTKPAAGDQAAQGTQDNPVEATYGDTAVSFTVKITARADSGVSTQAAANEEAVPEGKVGFFYNGTKVGEFADYDAATGTATLTYDTTTKVIPAGAVQGLTVKFGGSDTLMPSEGAFYVKIAKADQNLQFAEDQKTQHVGTVSNTLTGFESGAGVNYSSSNTDVATVGNDGAVAIVAPGQATITARSLGNDWYNEASATYELTVTDHDFRAFAGDERGHWQKCAIDGCEATTAISAHQFGAWQVTPASATADGKRVHSCDTCGYREEQVIPKADAPLFESPAVSVHISAAADGVNGPQLQNTAEGDAVTYTVSSIDTTQPVAIVDLSTGRIHPQIPGRAKVTAAITRGDSQFVATYDLTVTDHEFDEGKVTTPATCTTPGVKTFACKYEGCIETRTEPIDALGHEWADDYAVDTAATCTADGAKSIHCMRCGEVKPGSERVVPATGHELVYKHDAAAHWQECAKCDYATSREAHHFGEWEVTKKAAETVGGERQRTCDVCGYIVVEKVAATGEPGVKPGAGDNGNGVGNAGDADSAAPVADQQVALAATGDTTMIAVGVVAVMGAIALAAAVYVARRRTSN